MTYHADTSLKISNCFIVEIMYCKLFVIQNSLLRSLTPFGKIPTNQVLKLPDTVGLPALVMLNVDGCILDLWFF